MKNTIYLMLGAIMLFIVSCEPQKDEVGSLGVVPTAGSIEVNATDVYHPVFKAVSDGGFIFFWDLGNNQLAEGQIASSYYPFSGEYTIECDIVGAGGKGISTSTTFTVATNDPEVANLPVWKELTGAGEGKTWVFNTDPVTGSPDFCYQTGNQAELDTYPDAWMPSWSWGQCVQVTPDINGEMIFDLDGGVNYTYHQIAGDAGVKGSFVLDTDKMTLTVINPYILDYNIDCTNPATTATGVFEIKLLTDDQMILWQDQNDIDGTGWGWSFKKKGTNPDVP